MDNELVAVEEQQEDSVEEILLEKVPVMVRAGKGVSREYLRLANKLGLHDRQALTATELEDYLHKNHLGVYPMDKVKAYLGRMVKGMAVKHHRRSRYGNRTWTTRVTWAWLALRDSDMDKTHRLAHESPPLPVLMTVEKIADDLGSRVKFYVSAITKTRIRAQERAPGDPFLAVTAPGCPMYVIERWDEVSFRS